MSNNERKENNKIDRSRVSAGNDLHVGNIVNIYLDKYHVFIIASIIVFSFAMYMEISNNYPKDNISTNIPYDSTILFNKLPNNIESKGRKPNCRTKPPQVLTLISGIQ